MNDRSTEAPVGETIMKSTTIAVALPSEYISRIDAIVGEEHRAEFIRRALRLAIEMAEMHDNFDAKNKTK